MKYMRKKFFWFIRTLQILAIFALFSVIAYQFIALQNESSAVRYQQTEKFSYSLTNLAAAEASRYLSQKKEKDLQLLINDLNEDPIVKDATIYDVFGKVMYQSKGTIPLPTLLKIGGKKSDDIEGVIPYISELYSGDTKVGYIRVTLKQDHILSLIERYQERGLSILGLLVTLAFIAGILLMAVFYKRLHKFYGQLISEVPKLIERTKQETEKLQKTKYK